MGHPDIVNATPFSFEAAFVADACGRPLVVAVLKATFELDDAGMVRPAEEQLPLDAAGVRHDLEPHDETEPPSWRLEPEVAWTKPATDVVVVGHAHAPAKGTTAMDVGVQVGPLTKVARVFGDRVWVRAAGESVASPPAPFERIPLVYERAFGGWDRTERPAHEPRNPAGVGFHRGRVAPDGAPLPNIEDPRRLVRRPGDRPQPVGFGFTSPHWQPRAGFAGTFDEHWEALRSPGLPRDFDRRFFNAASTGLVAPGYLRGDERVSVLGLVPSGRLTFDLPGVPWPKLRLRRISGGDLRLGMALDTIVVELDARRVLLLWRADAVLARGPHDVRAIEIDTPAARAA